MLIGSGSSWSQEEFPTMHYRRVGQRKIKAAVCIDSLFCVGVVLSTTGSGVCEDTRESNGREEWALKVLGFIQHRHQPLIQKKSLIWTQSPSLEELNGQYAILLLHSDLTKTTFSN